jgi:hypothetical protein
MNELSKHDQKFWLWFSKAYSKLPEGQDFPVSVEVLYEIWMGGWWSAYSVGWADGHNSMLNKMNKLKKERRTPMPYYKMEDLFIGCKTGREFGLRIEKWHGIKDD